MLTTTQAVSRLGTETAFDVLARAEAIAHRGCDVVNLGIGQPDFKTPTHIVDAAVRALHDGHHGYTPAPGILPLREAVATDLSNRQSVNINPNRILILPGGKVTMFFAVLILGEPGVDILYPNPGFPIYESIIRFSGANPVPIPLLEEHDFSFDAAAVIDMITPATRLIIVNSPANPTGGVVPKEQIDVLAAGLADHPNVAVLSDEIYSRILYDDRKHVSLLSYPEIADRVILLDGWSKTFAMTGWRLGYSVWPEELIPHATKLAINCHSCVNAPTQFAGIAALQGPQDAVTQMVHEFDARRAVMVNELNRLPGVSCRTPGGAFYTFPNIAGTGFDARTLQDRLLEEIGVATIAGTSFGAYGEGFLRFSYANSTDRIREAMKRIRHFLSSTPASTPADVEVTS